MARKPVDDRPLSPHATIYRWPLNALLSISHRVTGVCLSATAIVVVWWFAAAAISPEYFKFVDRVLTSAVGDVIMFLSLAALCFHTCNGVRHLIWDTGAGLDASSVRVSAITALVATVILTLAVILVVA